MRIPSHVLVPVARQIATGGETFSRIHLTDQLVNSVAAELAKPGVMKERWGGIPSVDQVREALLKEVTNAEAAEAERVAREQAAVSRLDDFEKNPIGNPAPRNLLGEAQGRPVVPLGPASSFHDPFVHVTDISAEGIVPKNSPLAAFLRDVDVPLDPAYLDTHLQNLTASHERVFLPALKDGSLFTDYVNVMRAQNVMVLQGPEDAPRLYGGHTGRTRETPADETQRLKPDELGKLRAELRVEKGGAAPSDVGFGCAWSTLGKLGVTSSKRGVVELAGIAPEARPTLDSKGYNGPQIGQLPLYFDKMKSDLQKAYANLDAPQVALEHLADYLQITSNTHMFPRGNNSMFMSHINYALERMGLRPIEHGVIDVWAYVTDTTDFRPMFYDAVKKQNPGLVLG